MIKDSPRCRSEYTKVTDVEAIVLYEQDTTHPEELNVGGYAGFRLVDIR
jgi:hypothetical protein